MPDLVDLWVASWQTLGLEVDFEARRQWLPDHLATLKTQGTDILGAYNANKIVGFVTIHPQSGWLDQLAVDPAQFGSGLAVQLMQTAKSHAPNLVELDVIACNARAIGFYLRQGFVKTGEGISPRSGLTTWLMRWTG
eukprot:gene8222-8306_t